MPKYSYTVINQEGQKLTGTIAADTEKLAQENLSKLGFPILDITEIPEEKVAELTQESEKFEFHAVDQNGRKVVGSIAAEDKYSAFKRLITEYHFAVEFLYLSSLSPDAKEEEKKRGVVDLYGKLKSEQQKAEVESGAKQEVINEEEEAAFIAKKIDLVLEKINGMIQEFADVIKPEEKTAIEKKADRLARMRTSKNIEYVKHLAEDLLLYVQNEEIYLIKEKNDKKVQTFRMDMKKLLNELHSEKLRAGLRQDTLKTINEWIEKHITTNESPSAWEKAVGGVLGFIASVITEPEEITIIKEKIRVIDKQIWEYYKIYIKENTIEGRKEIKESLRGLKEKKTELKLELTNTQRRLAKEVQTAEQETVRVKICSEITSITGWLFAIYFGIHAYHIYASTRKLPLSLDLAALKVSEAKSYIMAMLILLIIHAYFQLRSIIVLRRALANLILIPTCTLGILLIVFNV
ncbi:MAG: hypothetical protein NTX63_03915 [Candidatus Peregrinibacteria bacterium]|nr:hypothetical protein [Candidatus Peregrinibacteria bacterium]